MTIPDSIALVPAAGTILDEHGEPITPTAEQWIERLRTLYGEQGIEPTFEVYPEGIVADLGNVEMTHTIGHDDVEAHVKVAANAMRRGPLWRAG